MLLPSSILVFRRLFGAARSRGFTLLETLVAFTVIVGGILGPFTLASRSIGAAIFARNELIAANLAAEGIELVHGFRTSNVLSGAVWDNNLGALGTSRDYRIDAICSAAPCIPSNAPNFQRCSLVDCSQPLLFSIGTRLYSYQSGGAATSFVRVLIIDRRPPPSNPYFDDRALPQPVPEEDQMTVISRVSWVDRGISRQIEVVEVLYDWN